MRAETFYSMFKLMIVVFDTSTGKTGTYVYAGTMYYSEESGKLPSFVSSLDWAKKFIDVDEIMAMNLGETVLLDGRITPATTLKPIIIEEVRSNLTGDVQTTFVTMEQPLVTVL